MTRDPLRRLELEGQLLAALVQRPVEHGWTIAGLGPETFRHPSFASIGVLVCALRDEGRVPHWVRVRRRARERSEALAAVVEELGLYPASHGFAERGFGTRTDVEEWLVELASMHPACALRGLGWFGGGDWSSRLLPTMSDARPIPAEAKAAVVRDLVPYLLACEGVTRDAFEQRICTRLGIERAALRKTITRSDPGRKQA